MKKILFVIHSMDFGGSERSLVNLLHELPEDKYNVDILMFQKRGRLLSQLPEWVNVLETPKDLDRLYAPIGKAGTKLGVKVIGTLCARFARKTRKSRAAYRWKHFYCPNIRILPQKYDVAIAYGGAALVYYVSDRVCADKKLIWIHTDYRTGKYSAEDDRPYFTAADGIVSISKACVDVLKEEFPELQDKIFCIENITSAALLRKQAEKFAPKEYISGCNLLSVGRLVQEKGFDMAIEAAAILKKAGVAFRWFVLGDGCERKALEKQIRQMDVQDCFFLLGGRSNPYPYIKDCTALIQTSRLEGKSMVLDEAKILGTPIVATDYLTVRDQITEGKEGYIIPMTPQGIADGIMKLIGSEVHIEEIRSYLSVHSYGNKKEITKYMDLFDKEI
ncbi:MAG: glycosyltransferase [Oscillospiraceae bacterium]|nr:glycosyltransferase [Oscillospiraceae bacterium]